MTALEGFSTVKRDGIELPSDFTMTLNTEMKIGALEETLTVSGAAPVVDVQSTTKSQVLSREVLDAVPTGRTIQGMGQLITGVSLNAPDVGGSRAMQQTYMSAHGAGASQVTVAVDGLVVNGVDVDGAVQNYFNSSMSQEMVYTTSGAAADVAGGGVRLNMIPKDGGNSITGSMFAGYQNQDFQSDNLTDELKARGLRSTDGIEKLYNIEGSFGGPIKKGHDVVLRVGARLPSEHASGRRLRRDSRNRHADFGASPWHRTRRRPAEDQQRSAAAHVADQPEEQARRLQRSHPQGSGRRDDGKPRSGDRVDRLELADLHHRRDQVHVDRLEQGPGRRRIFDQLRAVQHRLPAGDREAARHAGVVCDHQQAGHRPRHVVECRRGAAWHVARSVRAGRFGLVRDWCAQREGGRSGYLGPVRPMAQRQWRPARAVQQRPCVPSAGPEYACQLS